MPKKKTYKKSKNVSAAVATGEAKPATKTLSGLDAAAKILADAGGSLDAKSIVELAVSQGLWSTGGKTPGATIYAAMIREIAKKGDAARFVRVERGKFELKR